MSTNPNLSHLDHGQILPRVFDPLNDRLRVDAEVTANIAGPTEVIITHTDDSIRLGDGTSFITSTTVGPDIGVDVNVIGGTITGELSPSGLHVAGRITTLDVTDTAVSLPSSPFPDRNALSVRNLSEDETLYVGFSAAITADQAIGTNAGWEILPGNGLNFDLTDTILIYARAETGKTIRVKLMELA